MSEGNSPAEPQPCLEVRAFREILSKSQQFALKQSLSIYPHMRWCFYYCAFYSFLLLTYRYLVIYFLLSLCVCTHFMDGEYNPCVHVCMDWTLGENLWSQSFILRHHTLFFCLRKGLSLAWGPQLGYTDCLTSPRISPVFSFPALITTTQHSHFFFQVDSGGQTLVFSFVRPTLYWPSHPPSSSFFSVIRGWTRWHFPPLPSKRIRR